MAPIPASVPVLGYLDDALLLPGMIALTIKLIPQSVWERCQSMVHWFHEQ